MSTYLSNSTIQSLPPPPTAAALPPPAHFLPFLMGHFNQKLLARLPLNPPTNFNLSYLNHQPTSSVSPSSNSSSSESFHWTVFVQLCISFFFLFFSFESKCINLWIWETKRKCKTDCMLNKIQKKKHKRINRKRLSLDLIK